MAAHIESEIKSATASTASTSTPTTSTPTTDPSTTTTSCLETVGHGLSVRARVATILGLTAADDAAWAITDSSLDGSVHMVHYTPDADVGRYGHLRGVVVDTVRNCVLAQAYGYTPTVVSDSLTIKGDNFVLTDTDGRDHVVPVTATLITQGMESALLRVVHYNGQVWHMSHRRLDTSRSRWGNSDTFTDMYSQLGGPAASDLFDMTKESSLHMHLFLLVHPQLANVSKAPSTSGQLVYLGWRPVNMPQLDVATTDVQLRVPSVPQAQPLTVAQANTHLLHGFYQPKEALPQDYRHGSGEFVIVHDPITARVIRVQSRAYTWRMSIRDNNPNLLHQLYCLTSDVAATTDVFKAKYPFYRLFTAQALREYMDKNGPIVYWAKTGRRPTITNKKDRLQLVWLSLLMSVPLSRQREVVDMLETFERERGEVVTWIQRQNVVHTDITTSLLHKRVRNILQTARAQGGQKGQKGDANASIRNLVLKEWGVSLYGLVRTMRNDKVMYKVTDSGDIIQVPKEALTVAAFVDAAVVAVADDTTASAAASATSSAAKSA